MDSPVQNVPVMYTATCRRDDGAWLVHVVELDSWTRVARLVDVEPSVCALAALHGRPPAPCVIDVRERDGAVHLLLEAAAAARAAADALSADAIATRRTIARALAAHGFAVVDIAMLLGVSFGRAQLLVRRQPARTIRSSAA